MYMLKLNRKHFAFTTLAVLLRRRTVIMQNKLFYYGPHGFVLMHIRNSNVLSYSLDAYSSIVVHITKFMVAILIFLILH